MHLSPYFFGLGSTQMAYVIETIVCLVQPDG